MTKMIMINGILVWLLLFLLTTFVDRNITPYFPNKYPPYKEIL